MKLTYEREADAAYVTLVEALVARTEQVDRGMLVDVDEQGRAIGIEVIRPTRRLPLEEIAERYHLASADMVILRSIWGAEDRLPFDQPGALAAAAG